MDNKYDNFCIYKIQLKDDEKTLYIGSTTNYKRRILQHKKNSCNFKKKSALYQYIRALGGYNNFTFEKILDYPCKSRSEGIIKEKELINSMNANLNSVMILKIKPLKK
jgi:hypothetical protein